jgi:hypothetical protein
VGTNVHYRNLGNNSLSRSFPSHLLACSKSTLEEMWVHIKIHFLKFCRGNLKWEDPYMYVKHFLNYKIEFNKRSTCKLFWIDVEDKHFNFTYQIPLYILLCTIWTNIIFIQLATMQKFWLQQLKWDFEYDFLVFGNTSFPSNIYLHDA